MPHRRHDRHPPNEAALANAPATVPAADDDDSAARWMRRARVARAWIAVVASAAALLPALATAVEALARALR
jgi:hypothetical protein